MKVVRDLAIDCLKGPETGCQERGEKKITLRVIELGPHRPSSRCSMDSARVRKVEEYEFGGSAGECL